MTGGRRGVRDAIRHCAAAAVLLLVTSWTAAPAGAGEIAREVAPSARILDGFTDLDAWSAIASDGVAASVATAVGPAGPALRLDFDLAGTAGYAIARRALAVDLPDDYEISFYVRADAAINDLQLKLIDDTGDNVWWFNQRNFEFPREWTEVRFKRRKLEFAWGPTKDRTLRHSSTLEFVVAAGRGGGKGSVYFSRLELRPLPPSPGVLEIPVARASSSLTDAGPALAFDGQTSTAWKSDSRAGAEQALVVDFGGPRELGGLVLRWNEQAFASRYDVAFSDDGVVWRTVQSVTAANGGPDAIALPDSETRYLRLALHDGPAHRYELAELEIKNLAFGESPNAFFQALARDAPRGNYPRGFSGEQPSWTLVGIDGGHETALLSDDGALEVARGGFSIEPFVVTGEGVVTWANVEPRPFLVDDDLPMPGVAWRHPSWTLRVTTFATGSRSGSRVIARYDLRNSTAHPLMLHLVLAVRPFQVNPPTQFLNATGGMSAIRDIAWSESGFLVNGERKVISLTTPDAIDVFPYAAGPPPRLLGGTGISGAREVHDSAGYASGLLKYRVSLAPHATATIGIVVPLEGAATSPRLAGLSAAAWLAREQKNAAAAWREKLDRVTIRVPAAGRVVPDTLRTSLAYILMTRDGAILRPGTRSYARSWIRDGAMMAESLLRLGYADVAADYLRWYAPHQFPTGKVPCCVDDRGADPVPENDSAGELLFLAAAVYRYTGDRQLLETLWPNLDAAARYLEGLRQSERTPANLAPARRAFYGLMPASISHEGYSEKPMHSYWDDLWALKGYGAAVEIATALGHRDRAAELARQGAEFRQDLATSFREAMAMHGIAYLPGSAELGDFDPTSTSIAFAPDGALTLLPASAIEATYERYWEEFVARRDGHKDWNDYTPYELRNVSAFVRLGWRERAGALLDFFLAGRRPQAWNQWPEVVGRDAQRPRFVGDMPHGWVASDFIRAALDLFAYERDEDHSMVLAAGVPPGWLADSGFELRRLRTRYGTLDFSMRRTTGRVTARIDGNLRLPPGGFVLAWPVEGKPGRTRVNGKSASWTDGHLSIRQLPATIVIDTH